MNSITRIFLAAALAAPLVAHAAEPVSGKVLVIDSERLLEGAIERVGDRYRVRQGTGEMSVPASPMMVLVADREAAFQLVKSRAKLADPAERVRLARWCLNNKFNAHAVEEAQVALAMLPDD